MHTYRRTPSLPQLEHWGNITEGVGAHETFQSFHFIKMEVFKYVKVTVTRCLTCTRSLYTQLHLILTAILQDSYYYFYLRDEYTKAYSG